MGIDHHIPLIITVIEVRRLQSGSDNLTRLTCTLGSTARKLPAPLVGSPTLKHLHRTALNLCLVNCALSCSRTRLMFSQVHINAEYRQKNVAAGG